MKIQEVIASVDHLKPNMFEEADKIKWLSRLDTRIYQEIICTHDHNEDEEAASFSGYGVGDGEKELLVGQPYDEMYIHWLCAQIDYYSMEYESFNNDNSVFESVFSSFRNAYNRSHKPKGTRKSYF